MADTIKISTQKLTDTAAIIKNNNNEMDNLLREIDAKMQSLNNTWQSEAGSEIRNNMTNLKNKFFENYKSVVESYAEFLIIAAQTYEQTESTIKNNAGKFAR